MYVLLRIFGFKFDILKKEQCHVKHYSVLIFALNDDCIFLQLHAVSRVQHGRQREPSFKRLRSPLSKFRRHCVLSGENERHALPRHQSIEKKIYTYRYISFPRIGIEPTTCRVYSHTLAPLRHNCKIIVLTSLK